MATRRIKVLPELRKGDSSFWCALHLRVSRRPRYDNVINFEINKWKDDEIIEKANIKMEQWMARDMLDKIINGFLNIKAKGLEISEEENVIKVKIQKLEFSGEKEEFLAWVKEIRKFIDTALENYYNEIYRISERREDENDTSKRPNKNKSHSL